MTEPKVESRRDHVRLSVTTVKRADEADKVRAHATLFALQLAYMLKRSIKRTCYREDEISRA